MKKRTSVFSIAIVLIMSLCVNVYAYGWQKTGGRWWYGTNSDNSTYYYNGWQQIDGDWYYFDAAGWMLENQWVGNYYVGADGRWVPGQDRGWTGTCSVWNSYNTHVSDGQGWGVDYSYADNNSLRIDGYFLNKGYYSKTFTFADTCTFWGSGGDQEDSQFSKDDFIRIVNSHNGLGLDLFVKNDVIVKAVLSS